MDRPGLADFLRHRRDALTPVEVGLPTGTRRRTVGLRREEVAALAGMSTDYYTRLEQARGPHPSAPILTALARALRLTDDERDHLFLLADQAPPPRRRTSQHVSPGLLYVLDRLGDTMAFVVSDVGDILIENALSAAVHGDRSSQQGRRHNHPWQWFTEPATRELYAREEWDHLSRIQVADLRATAGRRRGDADVESLIDDLRAASPEFAALWDEHEVAVRRADAKTLLHPEVGRLDMLCETLVAEAGGQRLVVMHPRPGTGTREKLELLRVIGTQDLTPSDQLR